MDRRKLNWITWIFVILTVAVIAIMLMDTLHQPPRITLPDTETEQEQPGAPGDGDGSLTVVAIRPDTVQTAVKTLARPAAYRRSVTVRQFWSGGSGSYETMVTVSGDWTRTDRTMPDGGVRHTMTGPEKVYVWYNNQRNVFEAPAGDISADEEQGIPTYEELLELPKSSIISADYRSYRETECIYAEAQQEKLTTRYWISVEDGLLVGAERLLGEELIYQMEASPVDLSEPAPSEMLLPGGKKP